MISKQVLIYGGVLTALLIGSYMSWTGEEGTDQDDTIVVLEARPEQLASILWESEKLTVDIAVSDDARGNFLWVTTTESKRVVKRHGEDEDEELNPDPADPGEESAAEGEEPAEEAAPEPPPEPTYEEVVQSFKAGKAGEDLLKDLAPFVAKRVLQGVGEESYEDFGLDEPSATLSITREGKEARVFDVGGEAYGTRDTYLLDVGSKTVYLIDKDLLRPLTYAPTRLPDRELIDLEMGDVTGAVLDAPAGQLGFEHRNRADPSAAFWAPPGAEEGNSTFEGWLDKALALKGAGYVQADEQPTQLQPVFSLTLKSGEGDLVLAVSSGVDPEGKPSWYASSDHTRGRMVKLHEAQASEAAADLGTLFEE